MKWVYKIIRTLLMSAIILVVVVPLGLYVTLSIPYVQNKIKEVTERKLTDFTGMKVAIGNINIAPFNRVTLDDVSIKDSLQQPVIEVEQLGTAVNLADLIFKRRLVFSYAEIIGLNARISKATPSSPLNIQPLIDVLSSKDSTRSKPFDVRINTAVIRKSALSFDVLSEPDDGMKFNPNHISISDLKADLRMPRISNENIEIILRRLAFNESHGFKVTALEASFLSTPDSLHLNDLHFKMPESEIFLSDLAVKKFHSIDLLQSVKSQSVDLQILQGSHISLADLSAFAPFLHKENFIFDIQSSVNLYGNKLMVGLLDISDRSGNIYLKAEGDFDLEKKNDSPFHDFNLSKIEASLDFERLIPLLSKSSEKFNLSESAVIILNNLQSIKLSGDAYSNSNKGALDLLLSTSAGNLDINALLTQIDRNRQKSYALEADISFPEFDVGKVTRGLGGQIEGLRNLSGSVRSNVNFGTDTVGTISLNLDRIEYRSFEMADISSMIDFDGRNFKMNLFSDNPGVDIDMNADAYLSKSLSSLNLQLSVRELDLALFGGGKGGVSGDIFADVKGRDFNDIQGDLEINDIRFSSSGKEYSLERLTFHSESDSVGNSITLESDIIDGEVIGRFGLVSLFKTARSLVSSLVPAVTGSAYTPEALGALFRTQEADSASFRFTLKTTDPLGDSYNLPLAVIYPVDIFGNIDERDREFKLSIVAPYLQQKNKLLENTALYINVRGDELSTEGNLSLSTVFPTKKGAMSLRLDNYAANNHIDSHFSWMVNRDRDFHGDIDLSSTLTRNENTGKLDYLVRINPSEMVFNDTVWDVSPAKIYNDGRIITVDNFRVGRDSQFISIDGKVSQSEKDTVSLNLRNVNLDYIFETLDIETAMFGGIATGDFIAHSVLSENPVFFTPGLSVQNLKYNNSLMGDADIRSGWNQQKKSVGIDALIKQPNGRHSKVLGDIFPFADSLDFRFDADRIEVGFMRPYMSAFTSEVSGYASGKARLWGNFKYIDMTGDIFAEDVKIKLDFTNTSYIATDSIRLVPGHIELNDITLRDTEGNTALLNGYIDHEFFKKPRFEFNVTDAKDMLVYDVHENPDMRWYGKIYGNGGALVTGAPGVVNIGVNMSTAPKSSFTFVLSDAEEAYDYNFITFRDRDQARKDSIRALNAPPPIVQELKDKINRKDDQGGGSVYNMNIAVDVNPSALVTIVMDPVGGDKIKAYGSGNLRMTYESANEDFKMYGTYTLARGSYNFTLQDIIIKDFTIRDGSSITFQGDPYAAVLDIQAVYSVNANLSDLDESFLQDKELNRTNVPVRSLLLVKGDIRQPEISFDLEFPTLTQDTYRKVRSIISTEDMMNRQIIYLLALSRFYTPDYMTTTKGNELVSVASSTISSQLSNILGQLSDNWSISPNFRSDKGDFSDIEVDLALSSSLLNNRLLLNGNFGYRDKSLNNNTFIGDFDIEYLLNRTGSVRLKAYNRYNDRNYYLRSALTTQGVGVVFKKDFDNFFTFLRRKKTEDVKLPADSVIPADSVGPTFIIKSHMIGNDTVPADTILNRGRFQINLDNL